MILKKVFILQNLKCLFFYFQQIQAQTIVIIHPGSMNLRMGRASDLNPVTVLNAIARRRRPGGLTHNDPFLPPLVPRVRF